MNNWYEPKGGRQSSHWNPCILPLLLSALWPARSGDTAVHRTKRGACHHALWETSTWTKRCCCCSVAQSCSTLCDPMDCSTRGFPVLYYAQEFAQTRVHWVGDAIQPSHSLPPLFLPTFNLSWHQGLFQWVSFLHQVAKVLEPQLQHQSFQWIFRTYFL